MNTSRSFITLFVFANVIGLPLLAGAEEARVETPFGTAVPGPNYRQNMQGELMPPQQAEVRTWAEMEQYERDHPNPPTSNYQSRHVPQHSLATKADEERAEANYKRRMAGKGYLTDEELSAILRGEVPPQVPPEAPPVEGKQ